METAPVRKNPTPEERPDLYDYYDCREVEWEPSQAYLDAVLPEHVKKALADRIKAKAPPATVTIAKSNRSP